MQMGERYLVHVYTFFWSFVEAFWTGAQLQSEQAWTI